MFFERLKLNTDNVELRLGATPLDTDRTQFLVWAPLKSLVEVELPSQSRRLVLKKNESGYHFGIVDGCGAGERYFYRVDSGPPRPDPASRYQPLGVHGPSEVVDPNFDWATPNRQMIERDELIIYEMHVGALTRQGSYLAAIDRLDEIVELGVTAIELMPLAESAGRWNWGYDGVAWYAPNHNFGTPHELRTLVDAAHGKGLAVIVDVVYNHFGPEGNYLGEFAPYFSDKHRTPWGEAPNFDDLSFGPEVRRFVIENAIYWLDEFQFDGLRVDAIHCTRDDHEPHVVAELNDSVRAWSKQKGREALLIAESNVYDPEMTVARSEGGIGFDAQWCDDFLHSVFAVVRPGEHLSNRSYRPGVDLAQSISKGFVFEGTLSTTRRRCEPLERIGTQGLVYSIQNHDFIGNHPLAQRLHQLTSLETQKAAAALLILSPAIPMLFMGEEFASNNPFLFFVDFGDESLRQAVVEGRRREYPQHDWSQGVLPIDPQAFESSKLEVREQANEEMWSWYQTLIRMRKSWRSEGLLIDSAMTSQSDLTRNLFEIKYANAFKSVSVVARLSPNSVEEDVIHYKPQGERILDSIPNGAREDQWLPNQVRIFESTKPS